MAALTKDLPVSLAKGDYVEALIANGVTIYYGAMVCLDANGLANPASDTSGLRPVCGTNVGGNTGGAQLGDGATVTCRADRKRICKRNNSVGDPVVNADLGANVYVEDDNTVNHTGGTNHIHAGKVVSIDSDGGIWVDHSLS